MNVANYQAHVMMVLQGDYVELFSGNSPSPGGPDE